jgi:phospholipid/cholesterol/gamma-HCH transport system substrate-binding protein
MENARQARTVGLFVFIALVLLGALILNFSKGAGVFTPTYAIVIESANVGGLARGAKVMLSGVPVGTVELVELGADGRAVLITCRILKRHAIHRDARFEIEQSGFLGDQFVSVVPTLNAEPPLADGARVRAAQPFNLQEAARSAVGLMQKLDAAATKIDAAVSRVDRVLLGDGPLGDLTNTIANFRQFSVRADAAILDVQNLVRANSPAVAGTLSNLTAFSVTLSGVATNLDGVVNANKDELQRLLANLETTSADLKALSGELQAGKGLAGALLKDEALKLKVDGIVTNFTVLSSNLSRFGILWKPKEKKPLTNEVEYPGRSPFR